MKRQEKELAKTCMYCGKSLVYRSLFCDDQCEEQYHIRQRKVIRNMTTLSSPE